jgi:hypothetical protein
LYPTRYNLCYPILTTDEQPAASKQARCDAKNPGGGPDSWKTQTECCRVHGGCGYSGGPSGRECWAPDFAAKKCVKWRLDDPKGAKCDTGLEGGFQYEGICTSESFAGGAAISNRVAPTPLPAGPGAPQDKMARPGSGGGGAATQDKMAPVRAPQDKMAPVPAPQDKMAPRPTTPAGGGGQVITIRYTGRSSSDLTGSNVDIPSGNGQAFTKVCGGVTKVIAACNATRGCVAFTVETKDIDNPAACGYLKRAGGSIRGRQGWTAFVRA